jgi:hypothetical protein
MHNGFVGYIFQKLFVISNTFYCSLIIYANVNLSALCIGKAANPFQVFIPPRLFVCYVLVLRHSYKVMKRKTGRQKFDIAAVCPLIFAAACCRISAGLIGDHNY